MGPTAGDGDGVWTTGGSEEERSGRFDLTRRGAGLLSCLALAAGLLSTPGTAIGASSTRSTRLVFTKVRLHNGHLVKRHPRVGSHRARAAIVGGSRIAITQAPWQVVVIAVISKQEALICGGSILSESEVLTAGHCVYNPTTRAQIPADQIVIGAGTADFEELEPGEQASVANGVRVHPYFVYNPEATQSIPDDVAVLKLKTPFVFDADVKAISLAPAGSLLPEGTSVGLTGFGVENPLTEELNGELNSIGMSLKFSRECGGEDDALFLCASTQAGAVCFGDSGSALTVPGSPASAVGVTDTTEVSGGRCFDGGLGGFADVAAPEIQDFIESSEPPPRAPRGGGAAMQGVPITGHSLTCKPGSWTNLPTFTYSFINGISGKILQQGSSSTYPLTGADLGRTIYCEVQAANAGGTGVARTGAVGQIEGTAEGPPPSPGPPLNTAESQAEYEAKLGVKGSKEAGPSAAQLKALLLSLLLPSGKNAKIGALLKHGGYSVSLKALAAGQLVTSWYMVPKGAHLTAAKPVLVATGRLSFAQAAAANLSIKLTAKGKSLLRHARQFKLTAKGVLTSSGQPAVSANKSFTLKR